ncbi:MAG: site-specific DNA-methyltransferase [Nanoarchaeota archaeon]
MLELNKIYLMDCLEGIKLLDDEIIDLIIIDPPYLVTNEKWDKVEVVNELLSKELFRIAKNNCSLYVWCGIGEKSQSLIRWFPIFSKNWYFKDLITWKKQRGIGMRKGWLYTREEIMWFVKDNKLFIWNQEFQYGNEERVIKKYIFKDEKKKEYLNRLNPFKRISNVWTDINEIGMGDGHNIHSGAIKKNSNLHFTSKPLKALERIIKLHTKENDLVFDCFMGSGSTALAAKNLNRNFIGIEIEQKYVDITNKRLQESNPN